LGRPFLHDTYLSELTGVRDQLKAGLSGTMPEPSSEPGPSVSDLAEKIKTLKATHNIEATPRRVRQKQSTAEESITARIRRRSEARLPSVSEIQPDEATLIETSPRLESTAQAIPEDLTPTGTSFNHAGTVQDSSTNPHRSFQQRISIERHRTDREPNLS
jgi:hypothetical protein